MKSLTAELQPISTSDKAQLLALLQEREQRRARNRLGNFTPYE